MAVRSRLGGIEMIVDRICKWIAWRLPKRIVYWSLVRAAVHGVTGKYSNQIVHELTMFNTMERWCE